jgi:HAE1 family hydrophobic/amphiphilic exporter-1
MNITTIAVKRPVGTIMFFIGILLLGYISLNNLSINLLPDLSYPKITVITNYQGSGPEEIERFITTPLESSVAAITGIKKVNSVSKEGISIITLEFHWGTDMDFAHLHTKEKVEEVRRYLPEDCPDPEIVEMDPSAAPIIIAVINSKSRSLKELKDIAEFIIKQRLEQIEGVARVEIRGGNEEEVSIEIDPEKVKNIGITLSQVAIAIQANNLPQMGGTVKKDKFKYTLKVEGEIQDPLEINDIVVMKMSGREIMVKDIGRAFYKNKIAQGDIRYQSGRAISMLVYRESRGNTVQSTTIAENTLKKLSLEFSDLNFSIISKEASLIISSINSLQMSLWLGALLAFAVLLLFLQNYRDPIFVSLVIPISVISTFVLMFFFNVNVNIMSLGGLVLGVGMFVDNSIIVLEAIFRHKEKENLIESVINGAREVGGAISASTFTTICIFLPVIYLYGITGKMFRDQALTVSFSLISSLVVALTLLPALSAFRNVFKTTFHEDAMISENSRKWLPQSFKGFHGVLSMPFKLIGYFIYFIIAFVVICFRYFFVYAGKVFLFVLKPIYKLFDLSYSGFDKFYHRVLLIMLERKIIAIGLCLVIMVVIGISFVSLKKELLPAPDTNKFEVRANTHAKFGFEETDSAAKALETEISKIAGVSAIYTESGIDPKTISIEDISVNSIHFIVECQSNKIRSAVMEKVRSILKAADLNDYSVFLEKNSLSQYLATGGDNFKIKVFYESIPAGKKSVAAIFEQLKNIKDIHDLKTNSSSGKPLFTIRFKEDLLKKLNISKKSISDYIKQAIRGESAGVLKKTQKNFDMLVRVPVDGIMDAEVMLGLPFHHSGSTYYIRDLVEIVELPSIKEISRESQEKYFLISGDVRGADLDRVIAQAEKKLEKLTISANTRYVFAGEEEEREKAFDSLNQAILLAIILVYMVMAAKFEDVIQPLIIMLTVPMGIVGAFLLLLATNNSLSIISGIGVMVLIGIGVNDAIVKIEYANQMRLAGNSVRESLLITSRVRLRPILMTTFTTVFGLIPMAIMHQVGSELQRPLAVVLIGGLICTTFFTLILIPVFYEMLENHRDKVRARKMAGDPSQPENTQQTLLESNSD